MQSKEKKIEENIDLSMLNLNEFKKHLNSQGEYYREIGLDISENFRTIISIENEYTVEPDLHYFCACGGQLKPDFYYLEVIIRELCQADCAHREYIECLIADSVKNTAEK